MVTFQFQTGSIRSPSVKDIANGGVSGFNSKLVRLEGMATRRDRCILYSFNSKLVRLEVPSKKLVASEVLGGFNSKLVRLKGSNFQYNLPPRLFQFQTGSIKRFSN